MKKLLIAMFIFLASVAVSQEKTHTFGLRGWVKDTLTVTTRDTIDFNIDRSLPGYNIYTICAVATTGTDTVLVKKLGPDGASWITGYLTDESTGSQVSSIIVTTTLKEYTLLGYLPAKLRLTHADVDMSCVVLVSAQRVD